MPEEVPPTETFSASEARQAWSSLLNSVSAGEKRVVIEKNGSPIAALISVSDFRQFERDERLRRERFKVLEEFSAAYADVPVEEIEREVARAVQEVREERRRYLRQKDELAEVIEGLRQRFDAIPQEEIEQQLARVIAEAAPQYTASGQDQSSS